MKTPISDFIRNRAQTLGFDVVRFTPAHLPAQNADNLRIFLHEERHGDMEWMATHESRRKSPEHIWPEAKTAIVLGMNYGPDYSPLALLNEKERALVSCYALNEDYHDIIKKRLKILAGDMVREYGGEVKVFVDTAPIMEKPLAHQAGLGWQGKHTCVVSREYGSWLFLAEILTTHSIPADEPEVNHCGSCSKCVSICPTGALEPYRIDARKCISYLTIEHKGVIPRIFRKAIGNRIYGCDDCLAICPWNKFAHIHDEEAYLPRHDLPAPLLRQLFTLDEEGFRQYFRKSPVKRIGHERFLRNLLVVAANAGDENLLPHIMPLLSHPSPLVRAHAVWAFFQTAHPKLLLAQAEKIMPNETHPWVIEEWREVWQQSKSTPPPSAPIA